MTYDHWAPSAYAYKLYKLARQAARASAPLVVAAAAVRAVGGDARSGSSQYAQCLAALRARSTCVHGSRTYCIARVWGACNYVSDHLDLTNRSASSSSSSRLLCYVIMDERDTAGQTVYSGSSIVSRPGLFTRSCASSQRQAR